MASGLSSEVLMLMSRGEIANRAAELSVENRVLKQALVDSDAKAAQLQDKIRTLEAEVGRQPRLNADALSTIASHVPSYVYTLTSQIDHESCDYPAEPSSPHVRTFGTLKAAKVALRQEFTSGCHPCVGEDFYRYAWAVKHQEQLREELDEDEEWCVEPNDPLEEEHEAAFQKELSQLMAGEDGAEASFQIDFGTAGCCGGYGDTEGAVDMGDDMAPFTWVESWHADGGSVVSYWENESGRQQWTTTIARKAVQAS